ncbi:XRE family transcriptional regulator [Candidatus Competibacter phosphatis]|uniref:XRE family transcriptional regulator n=1 Tax=Candidatus Competibacter phosphatis TaxID=221280 RepID=A0ABX1TTZ8_9GAMM|nr:XRE family transcriptional regulator [Candidatus Competibacter phosphatis]NMQ21450.1 XRE family transcriptional regulator [Candidatus Competibacter phosphatis]
MNDTTTEAFTNVWDALADTPQEAANLKVRSELMSQIAALVRERGWTQVEAARRCGVTQPRLNDLLRGRLSRFSLDALVNIAAALDCRVHVGLDAA